jgi:hypothetical protein
MKLGLAQALVAVAIVLASVPAAAQRPERAHSEAAQEQALSEAPASLRAWVEDLPAEQRRSMERRLRRMPEHRREHLFSRWDRADDAQRDRFKRRLEERATKRDRPFRRGDPQSRRRREDAPRGRGRDFMRRLDDLPPASRERMAPLVERWRGMKPAERRRMRRRLESFRTLDEAEQQALIEERFSERSPEERDRILESLREASRALPKRDPRPPPRTAPAPTDPD